MVIPDADVPDFASERAAAMKSSPKKSKVAPRKPVRTSTSNTATSTIALQSKVISKAIPPLGMPAKESSGLQWTFLTNHSHVLVILSRNPSIVLREVAIQVGITERAVQRIISDLEASKIIEREKIGRQNHYKIRANQPLRHPIESHRTIGDLLALVNDVEK